jgi:hypothetical protein
MKAICKPNFFIVGAPKAGTTALYSYLKQHPEVFMCSPKEPQFFAGDICGHQRNVTTLSEYLRHFEDAHAIAVGEASTCYLGSPGAVQEIRALCGKARIIIMLRNPIDVMYAEHSERLYDGTEHITSFPTALDSKEDRIWRCGHFSGERVSRLKYRELVKFSEQVKRFIDVFGWQNVHAILYDDFVKSPRHAYDEVLTFLGVSPHHECRFEVIHANRRARSTIIHDLVRHPPKLVRGLLRTIIPLSGRRKIGSYLNALNIEVVVRSALDQPFKERLALEFAREVRDLGSLIDRDLSKWTSI